MKGKGLAYQGGGLTVYELTEKYIKQKRGVRHTTQAGYQTVLNILKKDPFGDTRIDKIRLSDAKIWLIQLQENGRSYSSIHSIRGVLRPAFQMAVDDDLLLKNPFEFQLATVIVNDSVTREAITLKQMRQFIDFVRNDKHFCRYADAIEILFKTGLRISEFVGLTLADINLEERTIDVNHQLQRTSKMDYVIAETKTNSGTRVLPMTDEVYECFKRIIENRVAPKTEPMIDGHAGFLYLDKNGMPMVALHWEKYFEHIVQKYNKTYRIQMPKVTPHVCRHTYCSNMARAGMNPKTLQYLSVIEEKDQIILNQNRARFGQSSEKRAYVIDDGQISMFERVGDGIIADTAASVPAEPEKTVTVPAHERKPKRKLEELCANLPVEEVICDLPENERFNASGKSLKRIGKEW